MNKFIPAIAALAIAVGSYFTFHTTVPDAVAIATDTAKAKAACEKLLTPPADAPAAPATTAAQ